MAERRGDKKSDHVLGDSDGPQENGWSPGLDTGYQEKDAEREARRDTNLHGNGG